MNKTQYNDRCTYELLASEAWVAEPSAQASGVLSVTWGVLGWEIQWTGEEGVGA